MITFFQCKDIGIQLSDDIVTESETRKAQTQIGLVNVTHWKAQGMLSLFGADGEVYGYGFSEQEAIDDLMKSVESMKGMMWL